MKRPFTTTREAVCPGCSRKFIKTWASKTFCTRKCYCKAYKKLNGRREARISRVRKYSTLENYLKSLLSTWDVDRSSLSVADLHTLFTKQNGLCALTKQPMTWLPPSQPNVRVNTNISIDRIDAYGAYTLDNVRLVCGIANIMRQKMTDNELLFWCSQIVDVFAHKT